MGMEIDFTIHAAQRMERRDVSEEVILDTILFPDQVEPHPERGVVHYLKAMRFREGRNIRAGRVLRVVVNEEAAPRRVVSLYPDRRVRV